MGSSHDSGRWTCPGCFSVHLWDGVESHQGSCFEYKVHMARIANQKAAEKKKPSPAEELATWKDTAHKLTRENQHLKARLNSWVTRGRDLTLADPEMADRMAELKKRLTDDPAFAQEVLSRAGLS